MDIENMSRELPKLSGAVVRDECPAQRIRTWRERIGQTAEFPLHLATDVERAMVAEIAELRAAQSAGESTLTLGELFTSVGGWMTGGELGYPSFGSMDALRVFTQRSIRAALAAAPLPHSQSETLDEVSIECWSADQEDFNATELDSLLTTHENLKPGDTVWVGEAIRPEPSQLIDADDILTTMGERAHDIAGEHAEDYPDVSKEAEQELNALLAAWIGKHASPSFWTVANIRPYVLSHDDFPNDSTQIQRDLLAADGEVGHE